MASCHPCFCYCGYFAASFCLSQDYTDYTDFVFFNLPKQNHLNHLNQYNPEQDKKYFFVILKK
jgi:hypothetical protein